MAFDQNHRKVLAEEWVKALRTSAKTLDGMGPVMTQELRAATEPAWPIIECLNFDEVFGICRSTESLVVCCPAAIFNGSCCSHQHRAGTHGSQAQPETASRCVRDEQVSFIANIFLYFTKMQHFVGGALQRPRLSLTPLTVFH
ncbi:hypothetical protein [Synechococcus sp. Edmonson 11F2]|uniref:hypothetical protein n=1 Tax=Synechococcus sp. Edmonson 11F2 TaxID=2823733 RepID=UPI0020CFAF5A|nr:hypothetical protein [Synechococcus sp. Edmonson 11F2]MCP9843929.1 hypothetical protein [Synechococcus sp. Edmonson 11F2]MCP9863339.1 hypothetical protein [Synechococcus sp. Cruz-7E5]